MIEVIGWIGAFCFAICAIPQAVKCYQEGHADGLAHALLWLWMGGEICTIIYSASIGAYPVLVNCIFNSISLSVIMYHKYFPRVRVVQKPHGEPSIPIERIREAVRKIKKGR